MPITARSPTSVVSMMTMQVRRLTGTAGSPNFTARSITGTTLPRRLMTPRMYGGVVGTLVTMPYSMISLTLSTPTAYCSSARKNVRYWRWLAASFSIVTSEPLELRIHRRRIDGATIGLQRTLGQPVPQRHVGRRRQGHARGLVLRRRRRNHDGTGRLLMAADLEEGDQLLQALGL